MSDTLEMLRVLNAANTQLVASEAHEKADRARTLVEAQLSDWCSYGDAINAQQNGLIDQLEALNKVVCLVSLIQAELRAGVGYLQSTPSFYRATTEYGDFAKSELRK